MSLVKQKRKSLGQIAYDHWKRWGDVITDHDEEGMWNYIADAVAREVRRRMKGKKK